MGTYVKQEGMKVQEAPVYMMEGSGRSGTADYYARAAEEATRLGFGAPLAHMHHELISLHRRDQKLRELRNSPSFTNVEDIHKRVLAVGATCARYPSIAGVEARYDGVRIPSELRALLPHLLAEFEAIRDLLEYNAERDAHFLTVGHCHRSGEKNNNL